MKIQWLKNKHNEKFYPFTHEKAVVCGTENENTLDNIIDALNERIDQIAASSSGTSEVLFDGALSSIVNLPKSYKEFKEIEIYYQHTGGQIPPNPIWTTTFRTFSYKKEAIDYAKEKNLYLEIPTVYTSNYAYNSGNLSFSSETQIQIIAGTSARIMRVVGYK